MNGHVVALRDDAAPWIEDGAGVIPPLLDVRREGRAPERQPHLFGDGSVEGSIDFQRRRIKRCGPLFQRLLLFQRLFFSRRVSASPRPRVSLIFVSVSHGSMIKLPYRSRAARAPGGISVVAEYSVTT